MVKLQNLNPGILATLLQLSFVRGHQWLEFGKVESLKEIAERENIDNSYVTWMVNLTYLAPDIVAATLEDELSDLELAVERAVLWNDQFQ